LELRRSGVVWAEEKSRWIAGVTDAEKGKVSQRALDLVRHSNSIATVEIRFHYRSTGVRWRGRKDMVALTDVESSKRSDMAGFMYFRNWD
jgi:hypothetical protein